jgi:murein DD-endopeptidase MepM/ murein hydrolase activator NlpD
MIFTRQSKLIAFCALYCALLALTQIACCRPATAVCKDDPIQIISDAPADNYARFFVTSDRVIEATVRFECDGLDNAVPSEALPRNFLITKAYKNYEFLRVSQYDPSKPWHWGPYHYQLQIGLPSSSPTVDYLYSLPYSSDQKFTVSQSYCSKYTHKAGTAEAYAVDIMMPEGTPVLAARPGIVIACRADGDMGGEGKNFSECANYVHVKHDDGTYGAYVHLKHNGVSVKPGQSVGVGTQLGLSGATGWVTCPHLHFMIYRMNSNLKQQSFPFKMRTAAGIVQQLKEGERY